MAELILMTALSPTMEQGSIVAWRKKEGESIVPGDVLCEVETDKATMDYESTQSGTLLAVVRPDGSSAKVGEPIGVIGEKGEDVVGLLKKASSAGQAKAPDRDSGKASAPKAEAAGRSAERTGSEGGPAGGPAGPVKASPLARKLAAERGIDLGRVPGSGPGGRVVKADVEGYREAAVAGARTVSASAAGASVMTAGEDVTIPVSGRRAVIARRLSESMFSAPHYYLKATVRMDGAIAARSALNSEVKEKVGFNAFLMKYAAEALKRHPGVNASWQGDHIVQFGSVDIGLAVDAGSGLITPIVRNCGNKGVAAIDADLKELIRKAIDGKLAPEEYTGATFTISNLGSFGIEEFTAIINPPGSAILAVGEIAKTVVVGEDDQIGVAEVMKMTLSCDHRVIDGAAGGRFLYDLKRIIENPVRVLF